AKPVTAEGTIVGTFQYMSPEQLEGKEADERSDIFALGAVLYEMATGKRAFEGKSQTSVIAAILEREPPPISSLQPMSPPQLDHVVKLCLGKDPDERFQSAHDVKLQLEWIHEGGSQAGVPAPLVGHLKHRERLAWGTVAILAVVATFLTIGYIARAPQPMKAVVAEISPPPKANFIFTGFTASQPVLSPDGQRLVFSVRGPDDRQLLWVRSLDSPTAQPLEGTDGASFPFWSPDSQYIGFFGRGKLNRIDASGGPPLAIADAPFGRGGTWGTDDTILFAPDQGGVIFRVPASGGTPQAATILDQALNQTTHRWPQFLPDGKHYIFWAGRPMAEDSGIFAGSLDGNKPKLLLHNQWNAIYAPPGYLLFVRQGTLMSQRFHASSLQIEGEAVPLSQNAAVDASVGCGTFSISENGTLVYKVGGTAGTSRVLWFGRSGNQIGESGTPGDFATVSISPDGNRLAVGMLQPNAVWVFDIPRDTKTRVTFNAATNGQPAWLSEGKSVGFFTNRSGQNHIYQKAADGTGVATPVVADDAAEMYPNFTFDGRYVIFERQTTQSNSHIEIWAMPLFGERKMFSVVQSEFDAIWPSVSPDGKWLAYTSAESGRDEIYIVPFLHGSGKWLVSTSGGTRPRWRRDGKELFYLSAENKIVSAEIFESGSGITVGNVRPLFQASPASNPGWSFDVSADGKKFVIVTEGAEKSAEPLRLVTNWQALLKKQ
ncbi:MAG TPA: protein kinase, partial [Candidatus Acidoferrales bacterium]|nr:protein kinase [Candidatus Acidoferrales bacterium]